MLHELADPIDAAVPKFVVFNKEQDRAVIVSEGDCMYVSLPKRDRKVLEYDVDDHEGLRCIQNVVCDNKYAYVLANKHNGQLGFYLLRFNLDNPSDSKFIINWDNKLDIDDCAIFLMSEAGWGQEPDSIICSYKMIGFNTYNVFVIDLKNEDTLIKYWHESYALWESPVRGFLLSNNDYLVISKDGVQLLCLGKGKPKMIRDAEG